ncbi:hypothetical protein F5882DRAFT_498612 [Hyaloscypha sp. PMI_1271]|nr:hypothetical protein F5882DRAFT_498612 [Hyaloscypha sp. PMI_1271]
MQEEILSKKLLIFTDQQVYWSCWNAVWIEEVVLEDVFNINFHRNPVKTGTRDIEFSSIVEPRDMYRLYQSLVNAYRERQLTLKSDILNAFSGLCQAMATIRDESFHWGLPVSKFDRYLCWNLRGGGTRNYAFCSPDTGGSAVFSVPFPSWSWAAWHGTSSYSWISWKGDVDQDASLPEITFFGYDTDGRLKQINQSLSTAAGAETHVPKDCQSEEPVGFPSQWKGEPQIIHEAFCKGPVNTGLLHFWTSTATLTVRQDLDLSGGQYSIVDVEYSGHSVWIDAAAHLHFRDAEVMSKLPEGVIKEPIKGAKRYKILAMDFVVVSSYSTSSLHALAVEWKDGIAYRIGVAYIPQRYWVGLLNKAWKQVILG